MFQAAYSKILEQYLGNYSTSINTTSPINQLGVTIKQAGSQLVFVIPTGDEPRVFDQRLVKETIDFYWLIIYQCDEAQLLRLTQPVGATTAG